MVLVWPIISFANIEFASYFLFMPLAFCVGVAAFYFSVRAYQLPLRPAMDLCLVSLVGCFIGARLLHVFFEQPGFYFSHPTHVLRIWQGGFVFYGGLLGALLTGWIYSRRVLKVAPLTWLNPVALSLPPAYFVGRFATLMSGSGYGRPTANFFGIVYPPGSEAPVGVALHPTPLYSMGWTILVGGILWSVHQRKEPRHTGELFYLWMILHGSGRLWIEFFRFDDRGPSWITLSLSSWMSLAMIVIGVVAHFVMTQESKRPSP